MIITLQGPSRHTAWLPAHRPEPLLGCPTGSTMEPAETPRPAPAEAWLVFDGLRGRRGPRRRKTARTLQDRNILYLSLDTATQGIIGAGIGSFLAIFLVRMGASNV